MKTIKITCDGTDYVDFKILIPFQGHLKTLSEENLEKLKKSIIKYGFTVPAFIWQSGKKKYILDAHQRQLALKSLFEDGYTIPDIPIVYIQAKNKTEAKEKLLHITSQYGEFEKEGLDDFLLSIDADEELFETLRLTDKEIDMSVFSEPEPEVEITEGRGQKYNNDEKPEIEEYKLIYRIESIIKINTKKCIELFAGRGALTYWYKRNFNKVITNDKQKFDDIRHDYNITANNFIKNELHKHLDFDYIDFDDEGCSGEEIQNFFKVIKDKREPFILAITDGMGLNLKCLGNINFHKTYMIRANKVVQPKIKDYYGFVQIFREFIEKVTVSNGFKATELSLYLKDNGNVIYATYLVKGLT